MTFETHFLTDDDTDEFVRMFTRGDTWKVIIKATGLSRWILDKEAILLGLGDKTNNYRVKERQCDMLRTSTDELYLQNVNPKHIADEYRELYKIGEDK